MSNTRAPWHGGTLASTGRMLAALAGLSGAMAVPSGLRAQVGHDPSGSPFRDITTSQGISLYYGRFAGARAAAPVGARPGAFSAVRLETRLSGPIDLYATMGFASSSRFVVVPSDTGANRVIGPVDQTLVIGDLAFILNLTGAKSWHGWAPYIGMGFGLLQPSTARTDPGGFKVGSNFVAIPTIGTRFYIARRLALQVEARDYVLRYEWPSSYFDPRDSTNAILPVVLPLGSKARQITHNYTVSAGLSYRFTF